jgi:hypothetical protein
MTVAAIIFSNVLRSNAKVSYPFVTVLRPTNALFQVVHRKESSEPTRTLMALGHPTLAPPGT